MPTSQSSDVDDVFDSDPFFSSDQPQRETEPSTDTSLDMDELPQEDVPTITVTSPEPEPAPFPEPLPGHTAEERLLNTIVGSTPEDGPVDTPQADLAGEIKALRSELETALGEQQEALASRDRARRDLQVFKTRFAALETDLATARAEAAKASQLKLQSDTRYADAERQWTDKLAQLRRMLDDVEVMRDELNSNRVPKILFTGTLAAGVLGAVIALFIGYSLGRPDAQDVEGTSPGLPPSSPHALSPSVTPTPPIPPSPQIARPSAPPPPHEHLPAPASLLKHSEPVIITSKEAAPINLPALKGSRWSCTTIGRETTIVFQYGLFSAGSDLTTPAMQDLGTIAAALKGTRFHLEIEGHTDSTSQSKSSSSGSNNKALGLSRAKRVSTYLTQQCGLAPERITVSSAGEFRPPFPNTTAQNRKMNRTVVLKVRDL